MTWRKWIGYYSILLLIVCIVSEFFLRMIVPYYPLAEIPPYLYKTHHVNGWTLQEGFEGTVEYPEGKVSYTVDSKNLRASSSKIDSDLDGKRIYIIGDSFTFGIGVDNKDTYPAQLRNLLVERHSQWKIANLGIPGYGTKQSFVRLKEFSDKWGIPDIVIYLFCDNDPVDNIAGDKIVVNGIRIDSVRKHKELLSYLAHAYYHSHLLALILDQAYARWFNPRIAKYKEMRELNKDVSLREDGIATQQAIQDLSVWCQQRNIKLVISTLPNSGFQEFIEEVTEPLNVSVINGNEIFSETNKDLARYNRKLGHWNPLGNKKMAEGLYGFLIKEHWLN